MAFEQKTWVNVPEGQTPPEGAPAISAENFNRIEQGIADAHQDIKDINTQMDNTTKDINREITDIKNDLSNTNKKVENIYVKACDFSNIIKTYSKSGSLLNWEENVITPKDCWVSFSAGSWTDNGYGIIKINGITIVSFKSATSYSGIRDDVTFPPFFVKSGSTLKVECSSIDEASLTLFDCLSI